MSNVKVSFGQTVAADPIASIKSGVAEALMAAGLPGALSLDLSKLQMKAPNGSLITGQIILKPTISKKDGRVMYNVTGDVVIGEHKVKPMGNWLLPKATFTVDSETHKAYAAAVADRDAKRKASAERVAKTDEEIEAELSAGEQ